MSATVGRTALRDLRSRLKGSVVVPGDEGYDEARALYNGMIDSHPAAIARCKSVDDVRAAIKVGRETETPTAVRSGGHSVAGMSTVDDGLVIDVSPMKGVSVDPAARTARCGGGVTWSEFDHATQEHGLATTGGRVSTTGVAGFTLGGGSGWLERKHGLACDNLIAVELVTADGEHVRASATENSSLFWALHGGGGNFGVATAFEFKLHPLGPAVIAGLMLWPVDRGRAVAETMREVMATAPDEVSMGVVYLSGPPEPFVPASLQGAPCCALAFMYAGELDEGETYADRFRALDPAVDLVGPIPYEQFQCMIDDPPGMRNYWSADYLETFSEEALDAFVHWSERMPGPLDQSIMFPWGGAVGRVSAEDTPMTQRDAQWVSHPFAVWDNAADDAEHVAWARDMGAALKPFTTGGVYLNFIGDEGADRVRAAFGDSYDRLVAIKRRYDPDNVFRGNQNIPPG